MACHTNILGNDLHYDQWWSSLHVNHAYNKVYFNSKESKEIFQRGGHVFLLLVSNHLKNMLLI